MADATHDVPDPLNAPDASSPHPPAPHLPPVVEGLTHSQILIRARALVADADTRTRQRGGGDPWERRRRGVDALSIGEQRILVAATRLGPQALPDDAARAALRRDCGALLVAAHAGVIHHEAQLRAGASGISSATSRLPELIALGESAVLEHIDAFDLTADTAFLTYVVHWIRQAMQRHTYRQSAPVSVSETDQWHASILRRITLDFHAHNINPTADLLQGAMSQRLNTAVSAARIRYLQGVLGARRPVALEGDVPVFDGARRVEGDASIPRDAVAAQEDPSVRAPDADLQAADLARDVRAALAHDVSAEQANILRARYGIDVAESGPDEVQRALGVSKGSYDGLKERGERALALRLAVDHRPGYVAEAMAAMDADDAQLLRLAHGLDFAGQRATAPLSHAALAQFLGVDADTVRRQVRAVERQAALLMTRVLPGPGGRRHGVDDAGEMTPGPDAR